MLIHWHTDIFFSALSTYDVLQHQSGIIRHLPASILKIFPQSHKIAPSSLNLKSSPPVITEQWNIMDLSWMSAVQWAGVACLHTEIKVMS